ncbi:MAG TPA: DnaJ domain-containing protein [Tepidiformaceae bacterium]|nr:DnaJ domain-containing protein [Tepidiformaceae bacterium]
MAEAKLVDYYAILNLPPKADLHGIENAYARLSDELAVRMDIDETSGGALARINEAYSVLSRPDLRREYDRVYFGYERDTAEKQEVSRVRRRKWARRVLIYALTCVILVQVVAVVAVAHTEIADAVQTALGPLRPGEAK